MMNLMLSFVMDVVVLHLIFTVLSVTGIGDMMSKNVIV